MMGEKEAEAEAELEMLLGEITTSSLFLQQDHDDSPRHLDKSSSAAARRYYDEHHLLAAPPARRVDAAAPAAIAKPTPIRRGASDGTASGRSSVVAGLPSWFSDGSLSSSSSSGTPGMRSPTGEDGGGGKVCRSPDGRALEGSTRTQATGLERSTNVGEASLLDMLRSMHVRDEAVVDGVSSASLTVKPPSRTLVGKDPVGYCDNGLVDDPPVSFLDNTSFFIDEEQRRTLPWTRRHYLRDRNPMGYPLSPCRSAPALSYSNFPYSPDVTGCSPHDDATSLSGFQLRGNPFSVTTNSCYSDEGGLDGTFPDYLDIFEKQNSHSTGEFDDLYPMVSPRKAVPPELNYEFSMPNQLIGQQFPHGYYPQSQKHSAPAGPVGVDTYACEDSLIIQGKGLRFVPNTGCRSRKVQKRSNAYGTASPPMSAQNALFMLPKHNSLKDNKGYIYLIAKDQQGCRLLQRKLNEGKQKDVEVIFSEIIFHVVELMINPFANYLIQKLLDVCTEEQRMKIVVVLTRCPSDLVQIARNPYGTRAVQKLIATLRTQQQIEMIVSALCPWFLVLINDPNGNHVIQKCLNSLKAEDNKFIFDAAAKHCIDIACDQQGCCVLQRCIACATGEHRENLVMKVAMNGLILAQDRYGNYVVQFIMDLKNQRADATLMSQFSGNFVELSKSKYSSNVIEKCLKMWSECHKIIIGELISSRNFPELLQHPYANYVIQTALASSKGYIKQTLQGRIQPYAASLATSPYSKRISSSVPCRK